MQFLNPCIDVAFKKIFGSEEHKRVTISFLNSILELTGQRAIKNVQFLNTEQHELRDKKKENYLDILCTDQVDNTYIIEVQVERVKTFDKRITYYATKTYALQLGAAQSYYKLKPVIAIAVLGFTLFPKKKAYKSIHNLLDIKTHEHDLEELTFAFIELPKFEKTENELVTNEDKWLYFLKNIDEQNHVPAPLNKGEFEEACHAIERMTWTEAEINAYDYSIIKTTDVQGGLELAFEDGEKKGETKGKREKAIEIATKMLGAGIDIATIAQTTGLTIEEIKKLKK